MSQMEDAVLRLPGSGINMRCSTQDVGPLPNFPSPEFPAASCLPHLAGAYPSGHLCLDGPALSRIHTTFYGTLSWTFSLLHSVQPYIRKYVCQLAPVSIPWNMKIMRHHSSSSKQRWGDGWSACLKIDVPGGMALSIPDCHPTSTPCCSRQVRCIPGPLPAHDGT